MPKTSDLLQLNQYCLRQGIFWLQGPGGNTSVKDLQKQILSIKPSGYRLEKVTSEKELSQVKLDRFLNNFSLVENALNEDEKEKHYKDLIGASTITTDRRPSMETGFHAVLNDEFVFHIHSLVAILVGDMSEETKSRFLQWYKTNWQNILGELAEVEATMPGAELALALKKKSKVPVVLLKNHGAILQFNDKSFLEKYQNFELAVLKEFFPKAILFRLLQTFPKDLLRGPIKFYFPDFVILFPRINSFLTKIDEDTYELNPKAEKEDLDVYENWMATQILFHIKPRLGELPTEIIQKVPHLPTELVRQKIMEKQ